LERAIHAAGLRPLAIAALLERAIHAAGLRPLAIAR
jgi:hypothetical protein